MKFLLRSLLVLAIAFVFGIVFYYAVQVLPGASSNPQPGARLRPEGAVNEPGRTSPGPERRENDRGGRIGLRSLLGITSHILLFSVLVFISVLAKNLIFEGRLFKKRPPD